MLILYQTNMITVEWKCIHTSNELNVIKQSLNVFFRITTWSRSRHSPLCQGLGRRANSFSTDSQTFFSPDTSAKGYIRQCLSGLSWVIAWASSGGTWLEHFLRQAFTGHPKKILKTSQLTPLNANENWLQMSSAYPLRCLASSSSNVSSSPPGGDWWKARPLSLPDCPRHTAKVQRCDYKVNHQPST